MQPLPLRLLSSKASEKRLHRYVPYIYAGGAGRGIAVFSDNDKDWIAADPAYQLIRNTTNATGEGTMTLQVNFISPNHPATQGGGVKLNKTRTITFGFMAAPAKPQPTNQNAANTGPVPARANWPPNLRVSNGVEQSSLNLIPNSAYCNPHEHSSEI